MSRILNSLLFFKRGVDTFADVYVKNGIVTWETQVLDYPRTRPDLPDHEPRGCPRGASASWYLYSGNRIKYPLIRRRLLKLWRDARKSLDPVDAWGSIVEDPKKTAQYKPFRGKGGFVRLDWQEASEMIGRGQRSHRQGVRARPRRGLSPDSGHVDDLLRGRHPLPVADGRHRFCSVLARTTSMVASRPSRPPRRR